jgi:hypothetical protein
MKIKLLVACTAISALTGSDTILDNHVPTQQADAIPTQAAAETTLAAAEKK